MTDISPGPGWWLASDGRWYPPEASPGGATSQFNNDPYAAGGPPGGAGPAGPPPGLQTWPQGPVATSPQWAFSAPPPGAPNGRKSPPLLWIAVGALVGLGALAGGTALVVSLDDGGTGTSTTVTAAALNPLTGGPASSAPASSAAPTDTATATTAAATTAADPQSLLDELTEQLSEATTDFSGAVPAAGSATCAVTGIQSDGSNDYAVEATITNSDGVSSTYQVSYELVGPDGGSLGEDYGIVSGLAPGDTVTDDTVGIIEGPYEPSDVRCTVTTVLRIDA